MFLMFYILLNIYCGVLDIFFMLFLWVSEEDEGLDGESEENSEDEVLFILFWLII